MDPVAVTLDRNSLPRVGEVDLPKPLVPVEHVVMNDRLGQACSSDQSKHLVFQLAVGSFASAISRRQQSAQKPRPSSCAAAAKLCPEPGNIRHASTDGFVQQFLQRAS